MSDEDFEKQLELEELEKQKKEQGDWQGLSSHIYTDPNDGTVYEWSVEKQAWFPKLSKTTDGSSVVKRSINFREDEKRVLAKLCRSKPAVEDKAYDSCSLEKKKKAWEEIEREFLSAFPRRPKRSFEQLKGLWKRIKLDAKKAASENGKSRFGIGIGPLPQPPPPPPPPSEDGKSKFLIVGGPSPPPLSNEDGKLRFATGGGPPPPSLNAAIQVVINPPSPSTSVEESGTIESYGLEDGSNEVSLQTSLPPQEILVNKGVVRNENEDCQSFVQRIKRKRPMTKKEMKLQIAKEMLEAQQAHKEAELAKKRAAEIEVNEDCLLAYQSNYNYEETMPAVSNTNIEETQKPKAETQKRKANNEAGWFEVDDAHNTNVYVSNLPLDMTEEEFIEIMK